MIYVPTSTMPVPKIIGMGYIPISTITGAKVFATSTDKVFSNLIKGVCDGPQTHIGIIFECNGANAFYIEAYFRRGVRKRPFPELIDFVNREPGNRLWMAPLNLCAWDAQQLFINCERDIGRKGYFELQLLLMWMHERFGRALRFSVPNSEELVVCSEWVARQLYPFRYNLLDLNHDGFDEVTPVSAWNRVIEINRTLGLQCVDLEYIPNTKMEEESDENKVRPIIID